MEFCESGYCHGGTSIPMDYVEDVEISRMRGNHYDIVTVEHVYCCPRCSHEKRVQRTDRDTRGNDYVDIDDSVLGSPSRFDT